MQILIEISEENYRKVEDGRCPVSVMRDAIRNGKPLPKGHWTTVEMTQGDGCRYTVTYCSECNEDVDYRTDFCPNCGADMRADKDCQTCVHSDETDGSNCYECIKGIKDNYEADKERDND